MLSLVLVRRLLMLIEIPLGLEFMIAIELLRVVDLVD
jgi:hypothetical protein